MRCSHVSAARVYATSAVIKTTANTLCTFFGDILTRPHGKPDQSYMFMPRQACPGDSMHDNYLLNLVHTDVGHAQCLCHPIGPCMLRCPVWGLVWSILKSAQASSGECAVVYVDKCMQNSQVPQDFTRRSCPCMCMCLYF